VVVRGRVVKTTGDGVLARFDSASDAVQCAVDVQHGMADRNAEIAPNKRIDFRIGINVGDILTQDGDIFGDGVNVAARLQALAEAGGICVSRAVRDQVPDKLNLIFKDMGEQNLKNITHRVHVYHVMFGGTSPLTPRPIISFGLVPHKLTIGISIAVLALIVLAALSWVGIERFGKSRASTEPADTPYFIVDISDPENLTSEWPLMLVNRGPHSLYEVDTWISPAAAQGDPKNDAYWSLRHLKTFVPILAINSQWTGNTIPHGTYWIDLNMKDSPGFTELLRIIPINGRLEQVVDIIKNGKLFWSSPRPEGWIEPKETSKWVAPLSVP